MKSVLRWAPLFLLLMVAVSLAQLPQDQPPVIPPTQPPEVRLPNGKLQRDEILKAEHEANVKDAAKLADLAQDLKESIEKDDQFVLSLATLKKAEDIEKLAHKIRTRLRHD